MLITTPGSETEDVGHKAENHGILPPAKICYTIGRDFHDIDHDPTDDWENLELKFFGALFRAGSAYGSLSGENAYYTGFEMNYRF